MSKADKIESVMMSLIKWGVGIWAVVALREAAKRKGTEDYYTDKQDQEEGVGFTGVPVYTITHIKHYFNCVPVMDIQVCLWERNDKGYPYVLCGDAQFGRDFYTSERNISFMQDFCRKNGIEFSVCS